MNNSYVAEANERPFVKKIDFSKGQKLDENGKPEFFNGKPLMEREVLEALKFTYKEKMKREHGAKAKHMMEHPRTYYSSKNVK